MTNSNMTLASITEEKQTISARVNSHVVDMYKKSGIPLTLVIENSLIYFLRLSEEEKIKFLSQNMPDAVNASELKPLSKSWKDLFSDYFTKMNIPSTVSTKLLSGIGVGAVALIGSLILSLGENFLKDKK